MFQGSGRAERFVNFLNADWSVVTNTRLSLVDSDNSSNHGSGGVGMNGSGGHIAGINGNGSHIGTMAMSLYGNSGHISPGQCSTGTMSSSYQAPNHIGTGGGLNISNPRFLPTQIDLILGLRLLPGFLRMESMTINHTRTGISINFQPN